MSKDIYINGKFLSQRITGVQRVAIELCKQLDNIGGDKFKFHIVCPSNINNIEFKNIELIQTKGKGGYFWEQIILPRFCKKNKVEVLLSLCNLAPIRFPGSCFIHDLAVIDAPKGYDIKQRLVYKFINKLNVKRYNKIFTVSNYEKERIESYYGVTGVEVIYNGYDHILNVDKKRPNVVKGLKDYYLTVGSLNPNKNFKAITELAKKYPDKTFVIVGGKAKSFKDSKFEIGDNLLFSGYLRDEELAYLYENCTAFLFPSKYEGFGIPPMEALSLGCKRVICNDIPVLREIYEGLVTFVDFNKDFDLLNLEYNVPDFKLMEKYRWEKSARKLLSILEE